MPGRPVAEIGKLSNGERRTLRGLWTRGSAAFGSVNNLVKASGLPRRKVLEFLHSNNAYTLFRGVKRKFPRLMARARHINEIWCADLAQMDKLAKDNGDVKYLLVTIDIFSRFVRVQPMKNKYAKTAKDALIKMITSERNQQPKKLWVDQGREFEGEFKAYCRDLGIHVYHTFSETKAAYAERAIRSLKNLVYRYMEETSSRKYLPKLQTFVKTMNSRVNRSIKMAPKDVTNSDINRFNHVNYSKRKKLKFKIGDYVRISIADKAFRRGFNPQFQREIFRIVGIPTRHPDATYTLLDKNNEMVDGKFYDDDLILYLT